jgi:hypothetical protein
MPGNGVEQLRRICIIKHDFRFLYKSSHKTCEINIRAQSFQSIPSTIHHTMLSIGWDQPKNHTSISLIKVCCSQISIRGTTYKNRHFTFLETERGVLHKNIIRRTKKISWPDRVTTKSQGGQEYPTTVKEGQLDWSNLA